MNIFEARHKQKILFKSSTSPYKKMYFCVDDGKPYYLNIVQLSDTNQKELDQKLISAFCSRIGDNIELAIFYIPKGCKAPMGMYAAEKINID